MSKNITTLYHYCSTSSFLSIINNQSIWLSDVGKSNDAKELNILRQRYYDFIYRKYNTTADEKEKECCKLLLAVATTDGFNKEVSLLNRMDLAQELMDAYRGMRAYCFCTTELKDSLGQWRGYADNGNGLAIGFSKKYLENIKGRSLLCPISNFYMLGVSYERKNMDDICRVLFDSCEKDSPPHFLTQTLERLFHLSVFFKDKSFKEEKEWRIVFTMNDKTIDKNLLNFEYFEKVAEEKYKKYFNTPALRFTARPNDIVSHIEVGLANFRSAINHIIIGPKSNLSENDVKQLLISKGFLKNMNDRGIIVSKSASSYR